MITLYSLASKYLGLEEVPGSKDDPMIMEMLQLDQDWPEDDETPWCSAFVNYIAWLGGAQRSKKLDARSWLNVGRSITLDEAEPGFDVVILTRPPVKANGHVGFYAGRRVDADGKEYVILLGGNQGDKVGLNAYPVERIVGIRRLTA